MVTPTTPTTSTTPTSTIVAVDETVMPTADRQSVSSPIGWSSILAATVIALGVWLALHLFGIGVGLTALEPDDPSTLKAVGIGVGVWGLIAPLIALFIGGLVAGRVAPTINTLNAVIHGAVVWALALLLTMLLLVNVLGSFARGVSSAGATAAQAATSMVGGAGGAAPSLQSMGLNVDDLMGPINKQLQERGHPPLQAAQVEAAAKEVLQTAVRGGGITREQIVDITARNTALSRTDAQELATALEQRVGSVQQAGTEALDQVQTTALQAAESTGKVLIGLFVTMLLSLLAAIAGSILSVRRERREHVVLPRATSRA